MPVDNEQFVGYYGQVKNQVFNYLMYRLKFDRAVAEDLFMDVILKAYRHFGDFNPKKGSFKTWIFTLAHNHLVNFWRDNSKNVTESLEELDEKGHPAAITHHKSSIDGQLEGQKVRHVLSLMNESDRELISFRYFEELEYPEISAVLDKKEGAIRTGLSRALDRFGTMYKKMYAKKR